MKKVIGFLSNSKAMGMDAVEAFSFPDDWSDERIGEEVWYAAVNNAESFFEVVEDYDEDNEDEQGYISLAEIESNWEYYDAKTHDGLREGGGSFEQDFVE